MLIIYSLILSGLRSTKKIASGCPLEPQKFQNWLSGGYIVQFFDNNNSIKT